MESFDESNLDLSDFNSFINHVPLCWFDQSDDPCLQLDVEFTENASNFTGNTPQFTESTTSFIESTIQFTESTTQFTKSTSLDEDFTEKECPRKRGRSDSCSSRLGTKACRERLRREKLNERFVELSFTLEPGRTPKTDKLAILADAIRVLHQLKAESQEYKEMNEKLSEEIKSLKAEKNELREEKTLLKVDREKMEQQMKAVATPPPAFLSPHPAAAYHAGPTKMAVYPSYGYMPMWHYLPPSVHDTSHDQDLRPPAA